MNLNHHHWLVACDFSSKCEKIIEMAALDLQKENGKVTILHVHLIPLPPSSFTVLSSEIAYTSLDKDSKTLIEDIQRRLDELVQAIQIKFPKLTIESAIREGDPVDEILQFAEDEKVNRIVVGSHGRRGVERLFLGSVAEKVVRRAPVSVLVVKFPS